MSRWRRNAKSDQSRAAIVSGLRSAGVQVWDIRHPVDLLCRYWSNDLKRWQWQPLELKTPQGKNGKARKRNDQPEQVEFLYSTQTPVVTNISEALEALGVVNARSSGKEVREQSVLCTLKLTGTSTESVDGKLHRRSREY